MTRIKLLMAIIPMLNIATIGVTAAWFIPDFKTSQIYRSTQTDFKRQDWDVTINSVIVQQPDIRLPNKINVFENIGIVMSADIPSIGLLKVNVTTQKDAVTQLMNTFDLPTILCSSINIEKNLQKDSAKFDEKLQKESVSDEETLKKIKDVIIGCTDVILTWLRRDDNFRFAIGVRKVCRYDGRVIYRDYAPMLALMMHTRILSSALSSYDNNLAGNLETIENSVKEKSTTTFWWGMFTDMDYFKYIMETYKEDVVLSEYFVEVLKAKHHIDEIELVPVFNKNTHQRELTVDEIYKDRKGREWGVDINCIDENSPDYDNVTMITRIMDNYFLLVFVNTPKDKIATLEKLIIKTRIGVVRNYKLNGIEAVKQAIKSSRDGIKDIKKLTEELDESDLEELLQKIIEIIPHCAEVMYHNIPIPNVVYQSIGDQYDDDMKECASAMMHSNKVPTFKKRLAARRRFAMEVCLPIMSHVLMIFKNSPYGALSLAWSIDGRNFWISPFCEDYYEILQHKYMGSKFCEDHYEVLQCKDGSKLFREFDNMMMQLKEGNKTEFVTRMKQKFDFQKEWIEIDEKVTFLSMVRIPRILFNSSMPKLFVMEHTLNKKRFEIELSNNTLIKCQALNKKRLKVQVLNKNQFEASLLSNFEIELRNNSVDKEEDDSDTQLLLRNEGTSEPEFPVTSEGAPQNTPRNEGTSEPENTTTSKIAPQSTSDSKEKPKSKLTPVIPSSIPHLPDGVMNKIKQRKQQLKVNSISQNTPNSEVTSKPENLTTSNIGEKPKPKIPTVQNQTMPEVAPPIPTMPEVTPPIPTMPNSTELNTTVQNQTMPKVPTMPKVIPIIPKVIPNIPNIKLYTSKVKSSTPKVTPSIQNVKSDVPQ